MHINIFQSADLLFGIITIIAAALTILALKESRRFAQENKRFAQENQRSAEELQKSLSTRFHGVFPGYLPQVTELIRGSRTKLKIMGAVPSHGSFSARPEWLNIQHPIQDKLEERVSALSQRGESFDARLLCCDEPTERAAYLNQYSVRQEESSWAKWKHDERSLIEPFIEREGMMNGISQLTLAQFVDIRVQHDQRILQDVFRGFEHRYGSEVYPFFCWISDTAAVFSLKMEDGVGKYAGQGFYTRDMALVGALESSFDYYWRRASPDAT